MPNRISHILFCLWLWMPTPYIQCFQQRSAYCKQLLLPVIETDISSARLCQAKTRKKQGASRRGAKWLYASYFYTDPNVNMKKYDLLNHESCPKSHAAQPQVLSTEVVNSQMVYITWTHCSANAWLKWSVVANMLIHFILPLSHKSEWVFLANV